MSYVDLDGNSRWSERDHVNRTEALHRSIWSADEEAILNRELSGVSLGIQPMSQALYERAMAFKASAEAARQAGVEGRADAALLHAVLDIEEAADPEPLLASASEEVLALRLKRVELLKDTNDY